MGIFGKKYEYKVFVDGMSCGHCSARVEAGFNGVKGFLVWDFIIYNEITFDDMDGHIYSFFSSISDEETEAEWNKLVSKYSMK